MQDEMLLCLIDEVIGSFGIAYRHHKNTKEDIYSLLLIIEGLDKLKKQITNGEVVDINEFLSTLESDLKFIKKNITEQEVLKITTSNLYCSYLYMTQATIHRVILQIKELDNSIHTFKMIRKNKLVELLDTLAEFTYGLSVYLSA